MTLIDYTIVALICVGFYAIYRHGNEVGFKDGFRLALDAVQEGHRISYLRELSEGEEE